MSALTPHERKPYRTQLERPHYPDYQRRCAAVAKLAGYNGRDLIYANRHATIVITPAGSWRYRAGPGSEMLGYGPDELRQFLAEKGKVTR